jgi:short-subunit dehydrogenase
VATLATPATKEEIIRPVSEQAVVITGASSGIGRETALEFARHGASVAVAARNETALRATADEIERLGGRAAVVPTDVSQAGEVDALAQRACETFGRIDTWVNAAAVSLYGTLDDVSTDEFQRVVDVNLMGQVHGTKAALAIMRERNSGVIVNIASVLGERAVPLQSAYSAAKAGIIRFSEAARLELAHEGRDVALCVLLLSSVNTPLFDHARSKTGHKPRPIPPVYEPEVVARAVVEVAQRPRPEAVIGGGGAGMFAAQRVSRRAVDRLLLGPGKIFAKQQASEPADDTDNLFDPSRGPGSSTGTIGSISKSTSVYTERFTLDRRVRTGLGAAAAALAGLALIRRSR